MTERRRPGAVLVAALASIAIASIGSSAAVGGKPAGGSTASTPKVVMFSADGMRPDLVDRYAAEGAMPTMADLLASGVKGVNGLTQGFPPNTGVGWATLATGTWPSEHGSTNNTFHRSGERFNFRTSAFQPGILQADTIQQAAERAGKKVVSVEWVASRGLRPALEGPVVDFRRFFSGRGVLVNYDLPGQPEGANSFGLSYQRVALERAKGWSNVPRSFSQAQQTQLTVRSDFVYDVYVYDSTNDRTTNYDHALFVHSADGKDGSKAAANLTQDEWADVKVQLTGIGTAGFYLKAIEILPDLSKFRIYFTSIARVNASYLALGPADSQAFQETLASKFPTSTAADFAPLEAGIVDEDTYVEQGLMWKDAHFTYLRYILGSEPVPTVGGGTIAGLGVDADLTLVGTPVTDEFQHQFLALVTPTDMDGDANPYFDDVNGDGVKDGRIAVREGYIRSAYEEADHALSLTRSLVGGNPTTFVSSDHGFAPQWRAVNVSRILADLDLATEQTSNCRAATTDKAKECHAGGTSQIYVNRDVVKSDADYEAIRDRIVEAFSSLSDPENPGKQVVAAIFEKEELRDVDGSDSLHPNRSGDVVVVFRPPYQTDGAAPGQRFAFSQFFGQHGYLPDLVDLEHNVNMRATFIAAGPGIRKRSPVAGLRAVDVAPTASFALGIPGPQNARGRILYEILEGGSRLTEVTVLHISDYHGQLTPLSERADSVGPRFGIGGAAFLKPWFDVYRALAKDGSITVSGGDSVGATPPISNFFGDKPTIELMNEMGFTADGLGNHNFDRGQEYLRNELVPLAEFQYLSANILDPQTNDTPKEWQKSHPYFFGRLKVGVIGFSNPDIPTLVSPDALSPFVVTDPLEAVNKRAEQLRRDGFAPVIALGHLGATAGTLTDPAGPLVDLADNVSGVDAVIGDHTDFQVLDVRSNGVLVTENRSRGIRFTRIRIAADSSTGAVVYKTADFHRPWNIGVTPDATIQARIDELRAQLDPILSTVVGNSSVFVPRTDSCGNPAGRTCESLEGNVVTDSMRTTYLTDFAITNSGGLRADLTCPTTDDADDFCPAYTPPPYPITRGQVLAVLPFGNVVATLTVSGAELKTYLENGVSRMPNVDGRFAQVSGLCFTYDIAAPAGSRVTGAVRQAADGSCTGAAVDLSSSAAYSLAINDFMASGGDGYPDVSSRITTRDFMDQVAADYLSANSPIAPAIQGRVQCVDGNGATAPNCPTVSS